MSLDSAAVTGVETEKSVEELLNEFFTLYFNGQPFQSPDGEQTFQVAKLAFQAGPLDFSAPTRAVIHTVFADMKPQKVFTSNVAVKEYVTPATLLIYVRVNNQGNKGRESDFMARRIGDEVKYLFESPGMRAAISQKGITHARVVRGPVPQPFPGYQVRILTVKVTLRYSIAMGVQPGEE